MIEEFTPQVMASSIVLILFCAPIIAAAISIVCLWLYRKAVIRAMSAPSQSQPSSSIRLNLTASNPQPVQRSNTSATEAYRAAVEAPRRDAVSHCAAVIAAALPLSLAAQVAYPSGLGATAVVLGVWIYSWASVPMMLLILPFSWPKTLGMISFYFLIYAVLCLYATSVSNIPALQFGSVDVSERSGVTPVLMALVWLTTNAVPTLLCFLCFNRKIRAVAPSALALVSLMITGIWFSWVWAWMPSAETAKLAVSEALSIDPNWHGVTLALTTLTSLAIASRLMVGAIAKAYRQKSISDRSLNLIAIFLVYLTMYTMWLTVGGLHWMGMIPVSVFIYWLVIKLLYRRKRPPRDSLSLCFLRVFALGNVTQDLLDSLAKYWRNIGNVQMITGPDIAIGTVQPHQFLDFLSGDLRRHFIADQDDLDSATVQLSQKRDPDGRFRINTLFCYEDTWQMALKPMVADGARVLMDLRSFSQANSGCREELRFLAAEIPFRQCLLIVDQTTDRAFLNQSIQEALDSARANACNTPESFSQLRQLEFEPGDHNVRRLLKSLLT